MIVEPLIYVSFIFSFQKKAEGQALLEQVYYHLDLIEKDYFGLQFTDAANVNVSISCHNVQFTISFLCPMSI